MNVNSSILKSVKGSWSEKLSIDIDLEIIETAFKYLHKSFEDWYVIYAI